MVMPSVVTTSVFTISTSCSHSCLVDKRILEHVSRCYAFFTTFICHLMSQVCGLRCTKSSPTPLHVVSSCCGMLTDAVFLATTVGHDHHAPWSDETAIPWQPTAQSKAERMPRAAVCCSKHSTERTRQRSRKVGGVHSRRGWVSKHEKPPATSHST